MAAKKDYDKIRDAYASWCAVEAEGKLDIFGLPKNQAEFARLKQVTPRTLQRWAKEDTFEALVDKRREQYVEDGGPLGDNLSAMVTQRQATDPRVVRRIMDEQIASHETEGESVEESDYLSVRARIVSEAMGGDQRAQDLYMKYWGQTWVEQEQSADDELAGLSDTDLIDRVLRLVGPEAVRDWLTAAGEAA